MNYCSSCSAPLDRTDVCPRCRTRVETPVTWFGQGAGPGAAPAWVPPSTPPPTPAPGPPVPRRSRRVVGLAVAAVAVVGLTTVGVALAGQRDGTPEGGVEAGQVDDGPSGSSAGAGATTAGGADPTGGADPAGAAAQTAPGAADPTDGAAGAADPGDGAAGEAVDPAAGPTAAAVDLTPDTAVALAEPEAVALMQDKVAQHAPALADLATSWVPQVSSKCQGLAVDLGPGFAPDGVVDTPAVTEAQILAFHLAVEDRYDALTTTAADLGVDSMPSACDGHPLWVAVVPVTFSGPDAALRWCDDNGLPVDECGARRVVPPGRTGTELALRD